MSKKKLLWPVIGLALAVAMPALADDGEEKKVRKIQVKKIMECADGEDCEKRTSRVVFIGDGGDVQVLHGDDAEWVTEDEVRTLSGDGHEVVLIKGANGEGEDGAEVRHRLHKVMKRLGDVGARLHGRHGGAFLGVQLSELTPELRAHFGVPEDAGVMVGKVVDDSPALRAGLQVGDIVTAVGDQPVASASALAHAIRSREDGETVVLEVWRDGRVQKIDATLEEREREVAMAIAPSIHAVASAADGDARVIEVKVDCEDGEDCTVDVADANSFAFAASACGDSNECEVNVDCTGGDCACTVNGEAADCSELGLGL